MEVPFFVIKRADRAGLQPSANAMEMEGVIAHSPGGGAVGLTFSNLRGLAINAGLHDVVLANGAVIYMDVPSPESDGVPFLDFESLGV